MKPKDYVSKEAIETYPTGVLIAKLLECRFVGIPELRNARELGFTEFNDSEDGVVIVDEFIEGLDVFASTIEEVLRERGVDIPDISNVAVDVEESVSGLLIEAEETTEEERGTGLPPFVVYYRRSSADEWVSLFLDEDGAAVEFPSYDAAAEQAAGYLARATFSDDGMQSGEILIKGIG